ncbi:MAG TPA: Ig-like domain repeat protein [Pseudolabrys sp.]
MNPILLTDGTVIAHVSCTSLWYKFTPDSNGSYINGTWAAIQSTASNYQPRFFGSGVLPDGRVIIEGGEYYGADGSGGCLNNNGTSQGAIYDPVADTWMPVSKPSGWTAISDAGGIVLPNSTYMQTSCCDNPPHAALFDPSTLGWTPTGTGKFDVYDEEAMALLHDNTVLTVDAYSQTSTCGQGSERYDPSVSGGTWTSAGNVGNQQADCNSPALSYEVGPLVMRPDGTAVSFSGVTSGTVGTAIYNVSGHSWSVGPNIPSIGGVPYTLADAPAAVLPSGNILFAASPGNWTAAANTKFQPPTHYFEMSITDNSITQVADKSDAALFNSFSANLLVLPTGQVMAFNADGPTVQIYTPTGSPNTSWAPTITSVPSTLAVGHTFQLTGTQLNGLSEGAYYGDDQNASTNFPIVRITNNSSGHVFFARTINHSSRSIAPNAISSTNVTVPTGIEIGASSLVVIANGIASQPSAITIVANTTASSTTLTSVPNSSSVGQSVAFAANVSGSNGGVPTGTVTFLDGATSLGAVTLDHSGAAISISTGGYHSCALTSAGGVQCWGSNARGQLGDGTLVDHFTPADVPGLTSGVIAIAAGDAHTCALTSAGGVKCWGYNSNGQLGDGTADYDSHPDPGDVSGLTSGVIAITAGYDSTCALTSAGGIKCWGHNEYGQLGDGTTLQRFTPVDVNGMTSGVSAIASSSAADGHMCALTNLGGAKCWGDNAYGALGDGTTTPRYTPVDVVGLSSGVKSIAAGYWQSCAVTSAGGAKCWGYNGVGELGIGITDYGPHPVPGDVSGLTSGVAAIAAGIHFTCALTTIGGVKCWGYNHDGELGNASATDQNAPVDVSGLTSGASAIVVGGYYDPHACALTITGAAKCWGSNGGGELGDGTQYVSRSIPVDVSGLGSGTVTVLARAVLNTAALSVGSHSITAVYAGDGAHNPSTSPVLTQVVIGPQPLLVSPASNIAAAGTQGGNFLPASFDYSLSVSSGSVNYSISGVPAWLDASLTSGMVSSPMTLTFTVNTNANVLSVGTYHAIIGFTNTTNGLGNQSRTATLTINPVGGGGGNGPAKTFVSAKTGADFGVCSITAPCATLNYALSVSDAGGEVTILDGGVFGPIVITQAIAISGSKANSVQILADPTAQVGCVGGAPGSCSANNGYGVEIAAGANDSVKITNVLMGAGSNGGNGALKFTSGGTVQLSEDVYRGNDTEAGPIIALYPNNPGTTQAQVYFSNSDVGFNNSGASAGAVEIKPSGNTSLKLHFNHVEVHNASYGIRTDSSLLAGPSVNVTTVISESEMFSFANAAVNAFSTAGTGTTNAAFDAVRVLNAKVAIKANGPQSTVILTNSTISGNGIGVQTLNGGHVYTPHNNTITGNGTDVSGALSSAPPR